MLPNVHNMRVVDIILLMACSTSYNNKLIYILDKHADVKSLE